MRKRIVSVICVALCTIGITGVAWKEYNRYEPLQKSVKVELGDKINKKPKKYIHANKKALKATKMDFSGVDFNKAGKYSVTAKSNEKTAKFSLVVVDTVPPKVIAATKEYRTVAGTEIKAKDLIRKVEDRAGIKSITFRDNQVQIATDSKEILDQVGIKYDVPGQYTAVAVVTDNSGNTTTKKIKIKVIEDYLKHINGFKDITLEQGQAADWMNGITKDEKIADVTVDSSGVDINTPGEYTLKYVIKGDDGETTLEKTVKVTVVIPVQTQVVADTGSGARTAQGAESKSGSSGTSGSGRTASANSYSNSSGGKKYTGYQSSGNASNSSSQGSSAGSGGNTSSGWKPGQSWEGNKTGEGYIDGPNGNTYEEGTWNPY